VYGEFIAKIVGKGESKSERVCALSSPGCLGHGVELSPAPMARAHPAAHVKWDSAAYCLYGDRVPSSI
jgi:hypothetical protein